MLNLSEINLLYSKIKLETEKIDKILIYILILFPFSLAASIFVADMLCVIISILLLYLFINSNNRNYLKQIKNYIFIFCLLYGTILISFYLSEFKSKSLLPSLFYFRYFLLSLCIYYLLKKYNFLKNFFLLIIFFNFCVIFFDGIFQQLFNFNLLGYKKAGIDLDYSTSHITSFFNDEKKLGSYVVRLLPVFLSLIYLNDINSKKYELMMLFFSSIIIFYSSERTALLLFFVICFFYFLISSHKRYIIISLLIIFVTLFSFEKNLTFKYIHFTFEQTGLNNLFKDYKPKQPFNEEMIRYYSKEHEDLSYTAYQIFKKNYLFGSGIKTFFNECQKMSKENIEIKNERNNKLLCSNHPHNTYIQILSEIGIFGFLIIFLLFCKSFLDNIRILFLKKLTSINKSYYFINLSIIINIMPLVPSGSVFNNWISLMIFFPVGFYLFIHEKNNNENKYFK